MMYDRDKWLEWRRGGLGASDIAVVAGLPHPWSSPYKLWADKVGLLTPDPSGARPDHLIHGQYTEIALIAWFQDTTGLLVCRQQEMCEHPDYPWARSTPDGFVYEINPLDGGKPVGLVECKVADNKPWDEVPPHYRAQALWQMFVTGQRKVWFVVQHFKRFVIHEMDYDEDDARWLFSQAEAWWRKHVVAGEPPDLDGHRSTTYALRERFRGGNSEPVDLDATMLAHARAYRDLKDRIGVLELEMEYHANKIRDAMGDNEIARVEGLAKPITWRTSSRTYVDSNALREAHPKIYKRFAKKRTQRNLLVP